MLSLSNCVFSVISVELRETTLTISDSAGEPVSIESEIMKVVSFSTTEISAITRDNTLKNPIFRVQIPSRGTF